MVSGGSGAYTSVEVFVPSTGLSCSLPDLPDEKQYHTMDSLIICGGTERQYTTRTTCLSFTSGQWITSHTLVTERYGHSSWQTEQGVVLMGGKVSPDSSEFVAAEERGSSLGFMQYSTLYACSMPDLTSDNVIITGGAYTKNTVSRYGVSGWEEDLPSLVVGRYYHGCGSYFRGDGTQVLLVAGGWDEHPDRLSSTEVLTLDSPGWTLTTPMPRNLWGLRGVTVDGKLYMTGGVGGLHGSYRDEIMAWGDDEQEWEEIGKMKIARRFHAATTIKMDNQAMEYCG